MVSLVSGVIGQLALYRAERVSRDANATVLLILLHHTGKTVLEVKQMLKTVTQIYVQVFILFEKFRKNTEFNMNSEF